MVSPQMKMTRERLAEKMKALDYKTKKSYVLVQDGKIVMTDQGLKGGIKLASLNVRGRISTKQ